MKENKTLKTLLNTFKTYARNQKESSINHTAKIIFAFTLDCQNYTKTERQIRDILKDSFGSQWDSVYGSENKKIRYARLCFERHITLFENKTENEIIDILKEKTDIFSYSKIFNINQNQKGKTPRHKTEKTEKTESESDSALYGKPNPTPLAKAGESDLMACVSYLQTIGKNAHMLAVLNTKLAKSGLHITYNAQLRKVA